MNERTHAPTGDVMSETESSRHVLREVQMAPSNGSLTLFEAVQAWKPLVLSHLSGFGNIGIDDVLAEAHLIAWSSLGDSWEPGEGYSQVGRIVRVLAMRARTRATRDRLAMASLAECESLPVAAPRVPTQAIDQAQVLSEWLPKVLRPAEAQLFEEILRREGDVDEAVQALGWPPRRMRQTRQMLAATAATVSNALGWSESGEHLTALGCLPDSGPWRAAVEVSGCANPHLLLGVSVSRWRRVRAEAETLMRAARTALSAASAHVHIHNKAA